MSFYDWLFETSYSKKPSFNEFTMYDCNKNERLKKWRQKQKFHM